MPDFKSLKINNKLKILSKPKTKRWPLIYDLLARNCNVFITETQLFNILICNDL